MKTLPFKHTRRIIIEPGEYYVAREPEVISTLLGSCVSTCLFDDVNGVMGMNHFLLAYRHHVYRAPVLKSEAGRYGIFAMQQLIRQMIRLGADRAKLKAKCFGGGNVLKALEYMDNGQTVGDVNVQFIREFLAVERIPLLASCLGGKHGRHVHFVGSNYAVFVKKIYYEQERILEDEERRYWKKNPDRCETANINTRAKFW